MRQFLRKYRVIVTSNGIGTEVSDLRCKFRVEKQWAMQPNMTTIAIYNLSANTENAIINGAEGIRIEAGYENGPYGEIFSGNIVQFVRSKEDSTSFVLTILSLDGDNFFNFGTVAFSLNRGMGQRQQIEQIAERCNVPATLGDISGANDNKRLKRGKVFFGAAKDYLRDSSKTSNAVFGIDSGAINMQSVGDAPMTQAIELNSETGLLGFPSQNDLGVTCRCLLNPQIIIGGLIKLNSADINQKQISIGQFLRPLTSDGIYRVIKLVIVGDTRGTDWYTEIEGIAQGEQLIPGLMPTATSNLM